MARAAVANKLPTELAHVHDLAFSPDGQTLLAAGGSPAEEGRVEVLSWPEWEAGSAAWLVTTTSSTASPGRRMESSATAGADGICQVFAAADAKRLARYEGHSRPVLALAFLPDGKTIASVGVDQTLRLWDSATGEHLRTLDNHVGTVNGIAWAGAGDCRRSRPRSERTTRFASGNRRSGG